MLFASSLLKSSFRNQKELVSYPCAKTLRIEEDGMCVYFSLELISTVS